jgi:hypothetical protein
MMEDFFMRKKSSKVDIFDHVFGANFLLKFICSNFFLEEYYMTHRTSYKKPYLNQNFRKHLRKTVWYWIFWPFFNFWGLGAARHTQNFEKSWNKSCFYLYASFKFTGLIHSSVFQFLSTLRIDWNKFQVLFKIFLKSIKQLTMFLRRLSCEK